MFVEQKVDCRGCTACCRFFNVKLLKGTDNADDYETEPDEDGYAVLRHREDGSCVYLGESGCTIYDRRPAVCKAFNCMTWLRNLVVDDEALEASAKRGVSLAVVKAAKQRLVEEHDAQGDGATARRDGRA